MTVAQGVKGNGLGCRQRTLGPNDPLPSEGNGTAHPLWGRTGGCGRWSFPRTALARERRRPDGLVKATSDWANALLP